MLLESAFCFQLFTYFLEKVVAFSYIDLCKGFPGSLEVKASGHNAEDLSSIPGLGRSPGKGNGNPLQYSCLEDPMDGGTWWATVHGVAKSRTRLSNFTFIDLWVIRNTG